MSDHGGDGTDGLDVLVEVFREGWLDPLRVLGEHVPDASGLCAVCTGHNHRVRHPCAQAWAARRALEAPSQSSSGS